LLAPGSADRWTIGCNPNEKVIGGGYWSNALGLDLIASCRARDISWRFVFVNYDSKQATTTLYAICVR
jgi:hypothetical protein